MCPYDSRLVLILCHFSCLVLSNVNECQDALGIENRMIKDNQIIASSHRGMERPHEARLNGERAWEPDDKKGRNPWIQVHFLRLLNVTSVATQGKPGGGMPEYVTTYKVAHSLDGLSWQSIKDENDEEKIFDGNVDRNSIVMQLFMTPVTCMYIRIYPVMCEGECALRLELYGCNAKECQDALGIEGGMIKDNQITASSHKGMEQPHEARLNGDRAWEPDDNMDMNPWIQVQFLMLLNITAVATQGKPGKGMPEYVTTYKVEHSLDGQSWQSIKDGNEDEKIFDGNVDRDSIAIQMFMKPVTCMYIRIYPVTCERDCALRLELYGCNVQTTTPSTVTAFSNTDERRISSRPTSMSTIATTSTKSTYVQTTTPSTVTTFSNTDERQLSSRATSMPAIVTASTKSTDDALSFLTTSIAASGDPNALDANKGSTDSAIIGSVVGVLFVAILLIALIWILRRRSTSSQSNKTGIEYNGPYDLTIEGKNAIINSESVNEQTPDKIKSAETTNEEMDGIYHDVQDKSDEYAYAYADVNASDSKKAENKDLVYVYAKSQFGGTLPNGFKDDKNKTDAVYHDVKQKPNEYTYIDVDLKTDAPAQETKAEEIPPKSVSQEKPEEGWEDNSIYATENNAGEAETQEGWEDNSLYVATDTDGQNRNENGEGWEDNTIYAATDDGDKNGAAGRQNEGWEDNIIYAVGDKLSEK